jgi:hypothetical protein
MNEPMTAAPAEGARSTSASWPVLAGRVLLVLLAACAVGAAFILTRGHDGSGARYVCPMHSEVIELGAGECPICHMALEPAGASRVAINAGSPGSPAMGPEDDAEMTSLPATSDPTYRPSADVDIVRRRVFSQEVRAPAWIEGGGAVQAVLYNDELATLVPGERAKFSPTAAPGTTVEVRLAPAPPAPSDGSTSRVRFELDVSRPGAAALGEGVVGWVKVAGKQREVLVVPYAAVLPSPEGPYVLVVSADGRTMRKRHVEIGKVFYGLAVVLSGLRYQERVAIRGAFFLDAERRLRAAPGSSLEAP